MRKAILLTLLFLSATYSIGLPDTSSEDKINHTLEVGYIPLYFADCGYRFTYTATPYIRVGFGLKIVLLAFFYNRPVLLPLGALAGPDIEIYFSKEKNVTIDPSFHIGAGPSVSFYELSDISYYFQSSFCVNFRSPQRTYTPFIECGMLIKRYQNIYLIIQTGVKF